MAALQVNGVFEAAQAASQQYIENIRSLNDRQASICAQRDADSRAEADRRLKGSSLDERLILDQTVARLLLAAEVAS